MFSNKVFRKKLVGASSVFVYEYFLFLYHNQTYSFQHNEGSSWRWQVEVPESLIECSKGFLAWSFSWLWINHQSGLLFLAVSFSNYLWSQIKTVEMVGLFLWYHNLHVLTKRIYFPRISPSFLLLLFCCVSPLGTLQEKHIHLQQTLQPSLDFLAYKARQNYQPKQGATGICNVFASWISLKKKKNRFIFLKLLCLREFLKEILEVGSLKFETINYFASD